MNRLVCGVSLMIAVLTLATPARAGAGGGFQTDVAVSRDGKRIATCRERVLYVLDSASLKVTHRIWNEAVVRRLAMNKDGSVLAVTDDANRLRLLNVAKGVFFKTVPKIGAVGYAQDLAAVTVPRSQGGGSDLVLLSTVDGSEKAKVKLPDGFYPHRLALSPGGAKVVMLSSPHDGQEEKVERADRPKEFKSDMARKEYDLRHDGKTATVLTVELPSGKELSRTETWYTSHTYARELVFFVGEDIFIMQYNNPCAKLDSKGDVTLFKSAAFCNYGLGWSASGDVHLCGGMDTGYYCRAGQAPAKFTIPGDDRLPGWPEYFNGFGVKGDGTAYGVTSAGRIAEISSEGKLVRIIPFF
jgi:hypothetical protein